ncbi:MAG: Gldg family protein [Clostridia bacterium]|nr:Gldg family protein [Clostridia bacterium]
MRKTSVNSRKLRYGGVTAALTALIIAVVIIVNVIFSALSTKFLWYVDMTPDLLYTLSDECIELIRSGDEEFDSESPIEMVNKVRAENKAYNEENGLSEGDENYRDENLYINIIFCDEIDTIQSESSQRYVYNTALELQNEFPDHIKITNYNIYRNPSAVSKYKVTSTSTITTTNVILEFGTEFRVYSLRNFFTFDSSDDEAPWAYDGEKKFTAGILAVTRAESPIACFTTNHGEQIDDLAFANTLIDAGYLIQEIDLSEDEIPEDCRLIVVFNPNSDFEVSNGIYEVDEIDKLDAFLDGTNSLMVFMSPDAKPMPKFEEYLEEWGIAFDRNENGESYHVRDTSQALTTDGFTIVSEYVDYGLGGSLTEDMRSVPYPKKVIFQNAMSISLSDTYELTHYTNEDDETDQYDYGSYYSNGVSRSVFNLFVTSENATAEAGGYEVAKATEQNPLALMTISREDRTTQESNYTTVNEASYVIACGSTDFASEALLQSSAYGNTDLLLSACRAIGREPVPVGLEFKPFADYTIDSITTAETTQYTIVLTVVPVVAAVVAGAVVLIRRKNK